MVDCTVKTNKMLHTTVMNTDETVMVGKMRFYSPRRVTGAIILSRQKQLLLITPESMP